MEDSNGFVLGVMGDELERENDLRLWRALNDSLKNLVFILHVSDVLYIFNSIKEHYFTLFPEDIYIFTSIMLLCI